MRGRLLVYTPVLLEDDGRRGQYAYPEETPSNACTLASCPYPLRTKMPCGKIKHEIQSRALPNHIKEKWYQVNDDDAPHSCSRLQQRTIERQISIRKVPVSKTRSEKRRKPNGMYQKWAKPRREADIFRVLIQSESPVRFTAADQPTTASAAAAGLTMPA